MTLLMVVSVSVSASVSLSLCLCLYVCLFLCFRLFDEPSSSQRVTSNDATNHEQGAIENREGAKGHGGSRAREARPTTRRKGGKPYRLVKRRGAGRTWYHSDYYYYYSCYYCCYYYYSYYSSYFLPSLFPSLSPFTLPLTFSLPFLPSLSASLSPFPPRPKLLAPSLQEKPQERAG